MLFPAFISYILFTMSQCGVYRWFLGATSPEVAEQIPTGHRQVFVGYLVMENTQCPLSLLLPQRLQQASRPAIDWGPSLEENRTGMYVATLAGSQSPKPLMVHMRKYGGITSFENTAIEVDREIAEEEEESMM